MKAARLHAVGEPLRVDAVEVPTPASGEVLVRVMAAGICGSDLHILDGDTAVDFPRTLGHEIAGIVDAVGPEVEGWASGDRVCIDFLVTCGDCDRCRSGRESLCRNRNGLGIARDGGFAEFVVVPERNLVRVPESVPLELAAIATDALATPFHAIVARSSIAPGDTVAVIGLGGLGVNAVRLLRARGVTAVVGIDPDAGARERARLAGAAEVFAPDSDELARWAAAQRPSTVLDFVGASVTVTAACNLVDRGGRVVVVGLDARPLTLVGGAVLVREEIELVGSYAFWRDEIAELITMLANGDVDLSDAITHRVSLDDVNEGVDVLRNRRGSPGRVIVTP